MRWMVLTLLLLTRLAAAEMMVVMEPPVQRTCKVAPSWDRVLACLHKIGETEIVAEGGGARLVRIVQGVGDSKIDHGMYLFVPRGRGWEIGGSFTGTEHVLGLAAITSQGVHGYRIDLGSAAPYEMRLPDGTRTIGMALMRQELYCGGNVCLQIVTSCDVFDHGRGTSTFRGETHLRGNRLSVVGDATKAGECGPPAGEVAWHD
jgi:hypothetical protein